jgi:nicotinate-nucleotide adenylyltransferase
MNRSMCDRLIFGGAFDPVHNGHIAVAKAAARACGAGGVTLIPTGDAPHKRTLASAGERLAMARLAAGGLGWLEVSDIEARRGGKSYTIDTVRELSKTGRVTLIIGADEAESLRGWKDADELARLCSFAVVPRAGHGFEAADGGFDFVEVKTPLVNISSTEIRRRLNGGEDASSLLPAGVFGYIYENGLYGTTEKAAREKLRAMLKPSRFAHTLGVVAEAESLARQYGANAAKARIAALLHDCAKNFDDGAILSLVPPEQMDKSIAKRPNIGHCFASAKTARELFGVEDPEILAAIEEHTFGGPGMGLLSRIIFVADCIEPGRSAGANAEYSRALSEARRLAYQNLDEALAVCLRRSIAEAAERDSVHPASTDALKRLEAEV